MKDVLQEFLDFLSSHGLQPHNQSDINGNNLRKNYRLHDDSSSKKSGFYKLSIEGDFGYGYAGNYKTDESYSFSSKSSRTFSKSEIEEKRRASDLEREKSIEKRQQLFLKKSEETRDFLFFLERCDKHPYLTKKGLPSGFGALHSGKNLIIPMVDFDRTWNYQRINEDGKKEYYYEAMKSGTWFCFEGETDVIYITEGYATGASVFMASGKTTLAAFDLGNIINVVKKVLDTYPEANIVIAADNDHSKKVNGKPQNAGIEKAKQIKSLYPKIDYRFPQFVNPEGNTDFNDLYLSEGLDEVKAQLLEIKVIKENPVTEHKNTIEQKKDNSWRDKLIVTKNGLDQRSTLNAILIMDNDENLNGVFKYDSFSKNILITKCPPWLSDSDFVVRPVQDHDYMPLECYLESEWGLSVPKNKCADLILTVAKYKNNTINPAKEYFDALRWDGVGRLSTWLKNYVSDGKQPDEYLELVGRKFMCGLAARAMYAGIKFDTMMILEGKQYGGKSFVSRLCATVNGVEYFLDDFKDIDNKDTLMKMQGKLVVEFPEITTMRKSEVNDLKAFVSRQADEFRPPYGRNPIVAPRQCVFIGTVNPEGAYFRDMTGNRRYWPVSCRDRLKLASLKEIMPQLHAEAAHLVKAGEQLWLDDHEYEVAKAEQDKRVIADLWTDKIEEITQGINRISTDELLRGLSIDMEKRTQLVFNRVQQTMHSLGWVQGRVWEGSKQKRGFIRGEELNLDGEEKEIPW